MRVQAVELAERLRPTVMLTTTHTHTETILVYVFMQIAIEHWFTKWIATTTSNKLRSIKDTIRLWLSSTQINRWYD